MFSVGDRVRLVRDVPGGFGTKGSMGTVLAPEDRSHNVFVGYDTFRNSGYDKDGKWYADVNDLELMTPEHTLADLLMALELAERIERDSPWGHTPETKWLRTQAIKAFRALVDHA